MLHIFDQTMSMIPFAIKTDMYEAMKRADVRAGDVDSFLASLKAEHDYAGVSAMLRNAWTKYIRQQFPEEETMARSARRVGGQVHAKAMTPPPSPPAEGNGGEGSSGGGGGGDGGPGT